MLDATVFYSQQATGKALKAIYISEFSKLLKIYDLVKLAREVKAPGRIVGLLDCSWAHHLQFQGYFV